MTKFLRFTCWLIVGIQLAHGQIIRPKQFKNEIFDLGEELTYKATFLGMTAGKATTRVDKESHKILGQTCYKIDVVGETSDWISWVTRVKDTWGAYIDTSNFLTRATYRNIREGKYKKDEWVTFDHDAQKASVQVIDKKTGKYKLSRKVLMPKPERPAGDAE